MAQLYFSFWANEYLSDGKIRSLTYDRRGILQTLWAFAWNDGSIPSDPEELGVMLGISAKAMRSHCEWIARFFQPHPSEQGKLVSPRLEIERSKIEAKGAKARESAQVRWDKERNANAYANASETDMRMACAEHASQTQIKEKNNPLPPTGSGDGVKQVRKPGWTKAHPAEVIQATKEIRAIWPRPEDDAFQPDGKTLVPGVSPSELASRLAEIADLGADLDVCVKIAARVVSEWKSGKWIKAPQHFFGKAKDAPFRAYYQAHVTNESVRLAS